MVTIKQEPQIHNIIFQHFKIFKNISCKKAKSFAQFEGSV